MHWDAGNYALVEKLFRRTMEFCNENEAWKLNVAHVLFMQEKYKDAVGFYQPIVERSIDRVCLVCQCLVQECALKLQ